MDIGEVNADEAPMQTENGGGATGGHGGYHWGTWDEAGGLNAMGGKGGKGWINGTCDHCKENRRARDTETALLKKLYRRGLPRWPPISYLSLRFKGFQGFTP